MQNSQKKSTYSITDKIQMIKNVYSENPRVEVVSFENQFLVNLCRENKIDAMIRGLRNVEDLDYEKQILYLNTKMNSKINFSQNTQKITEGLN